MGKRSNFERNPRDFYVTPREAVLPLLSHVKGSFIEPCAGDGRLISHLETFGLKCTFACDIQPLAENIKQMDVLFFGSLLPPCEQIITNPPWRRESLHQMIDKFRNHAPTWLLFDANWMFTGQARPHLKYCSKIISIGRVSWMGNNKKGMDDCCWYKFEKHTTPTTFFSACDSSNTIQECPSPISSV